MNQEQWNQVVAAMDAVNMSQAGRDAVINAFQWETLAGQQQAADIAAAAAKPSPMAAIFAAIDRGA